MPCVVFPFCSAHTCKLASGVRPHAWRALFLCPRVRLAGVSEHGEVDDLTWVRAGGVGCTTSGACCAKGVRSRSRSVRRVWAPSNGVVVSLPSPVLVAGEPAHPRSRGEFDSFPKRSTCRSCVGAQSGACGYVCETSSEHMSCAEQTGEWRDPRPCSSSSVPARDVTGRCLCDDICAHCVCSGNVLPGDAIVGTKWSTICPRAVGCVSEQCTVTGPERSGPTEELDD